MPAAKANNSMPPTIKKLMQESGVQFGTSGARGKVTQMTDRVCYLYTTAFIQYLQEKNALTATKTAIGIAGDRRDSTPRILRAVTKAIIDKGYIPEYCGLIPTPALALYGIAQQIPTIMITGSHVPNDRNGIKFNTAAGEILKSDEAGISAQSLSPTNHLFDRDGALLDEVTLPTKQTAAEAHYIQRYLDFFPSDALAGCNVGLYEHSAVGRDLLYLLLTKLGANVLRLNRSDIFIPVDTEAIREQDRLLARQWAKSHKLDAIVSTDGDGDRPLVSDATGEWIRGDILGILCAEFLHADIVVTPVSANTAVEKSKLFQQVIRTRIGSPFVITAMQLAMQQSHSTIVGYEANGGFLSATPIKLSANTLSALPTRDATIVILALLLSAIQSSKTISQLVSNLPQRFTASNRLQDFPTEQSQAKLAALCAGPEHETIARLEIIFHQYFGNITNINTTDGLRIHFQNEEIVHLRPSGNAPELRCYSEATTPERAAEINKICIHILTSWRQ